MRTDFSPYCALKLIGEGGGEENVSAVQKERLITDDCSANRTVEYIAGKHKDHIRGHNIL